jgi:hypothetical protein
LQSVHDIRFASSAPLVYLESLWRAAPRLNLKVVYISHIVKTYAESVLEPFFAVDTGERELIYFFNVSEMSPVDF